MSQKDFRKADARGYDAIKTVLKENDQGRLLIQYLRLVARTLGEAQGTDRWKSDEVYEDITKMRASAASGIDLNWDNRRVKDLFGKVKLDPEKKNILEDVTNLLFKPHL
jgi:hypothetical protein